MSRNMGPGIEREGRRAGDVIEFTVYGNKGEYTHELPAVYAVCSECEGHGTHLTPSIRDHGYSMEEFHESFDEEEREHYFRRGGMYDVTCSVCKGKRVELVVDEAILETSVRGRRLLRMWHDHLDKKAADRAEQEWERRMGC